MRKVRIPVGFPGHIEEIEAEVPDAEPDPWSAESKLSVVGRRVPRADAVAKVTGTARYAWDVALPGMLHARCLRSPHAAARVLSVDASAARAARGVHVVHTFEGRTVRFAGEEVAAVAAETRALASDALNLIRVAYEEFPFVVDLEEARRDGAPRVFDHENVRPPTVRERGDAAAALSSAAIVLDETYRTRVETHCCLETHGAVASWDGDELTVYTSTQATFSVRDGLAEALGILKAKVHVICEHMGGGFGSKFGAGSYAIIAAKLAREAGRPVKLVLDRKEEHLATGSRPDAVMRLRAGARRDGTVTVLHLVSYGTPGVATGAGVSGPVRSIYPIPNVRTEETDVQTNTGPGSPMRAPGHPQGCFALESAMDELAARLGMDPIAFHMQNDPHPVRRAQYEVAARAMGWERRSALAADNAARAAAGDPLRRGIGMAASLWYNTGGPGATVHVRIHGDGSCEVLSGAQDIGTGTRTFVLMVAAEELRLPLPRITVRLGHTEWPEGPGSGGSSTTATLSPAVRAAAHAARLRMAALAAEEMEVPEDAIEVVDGPEFAVRGEPERRMSWDEVAATIGAGTMTVQGERSPDFEGKWELTAGVQMAEVSVDVAIGKIRVEKVVAVHDCGRVINPLLVESQINGGVINGLSFALFEERVMDLPTGRMLNPNLEQYKIAGSIDVPEIVAIPFSVDVGFNSTGALGIGESPVIPTAAAIANAVFHATGVRVRELPLTPARVLHAMATSMRRA